jgi:hypothetical protein
VVFSPSGPDRGKKKMRVSWSASLSNQFPELLVFFWCHGVVATPSDVLSPNLPPYDLTKLEIQNLKKMKNRNAPHANV